MSVVPFNFPRISVQDEIGRAVSGYSCTCDKCSRTDTIRANGFSQSLPPEVIRKKFIQQGWRITGHVKRCPDCVGRPKREDKVSTSNVEALPRSMTPVDKRRVFREIDDNWDEGKGRYVGSATDKSLAEKLNVPRIWVEQTRKEAFGESNRNEDVDKLIGNLRNLKGDADRLGQQALELATKYEALSAQIADAIEKVQAV